MDNDIKVRGRPPEEPRRRIVVCIPAYNEERSIASLIVQLRSFAYEILVCDDGSTDQTGEIARQLGLTVFRHEKNMGKGASLRTLIEEATKLDPEVVVTMDGDGQHEPNDVPRVVAPILQSNADIVIGARRTSGGMMPRDRVIGNMVLDLATGRKAGMRLVDSQSGFRAYSRRALGFLDFKAAGMAIESQTLIDAVKAGLTISTVDVATTYQQVVHKRNPLAHFSSVFDYILSRTVIESPLLYLGLPGLIGILFGIGAGVFVVDSFMRTHLIATGTGLVSAILIITGAISLATGLVLKFMKAELAK